MKVRQLLDPESIAFLTTSRPPLATDPLDMELTDYVTTYRTNQQKVIADPSGGSMTSEEIGAHNWFGQAARLLNLPTDGTGLYTFPGPEWVPPFDSRTPGQIAYDAYARAITSGLEVTVAWEASAAAVVRSKPAVD